MSSSRNMRITRPSIFRRRRLTSRMKADLLTGARLFVDETTAKVLAPGTGKVKTGYLRAIARDDGARGGTDPPALTWELKTGRPSPASSKRANWAASTLRPTSPTFSPASFYAAMQIRSMICYPTTG